MVERQTTAAVIALWHLRCLQRDVAVELEGERLLRRQLSQGLVRIERSRQLLARPVYRPFGQDDARRPRKPDA